MPDIVFARWRWIRAEVHSVPLGAFQQVNVLEGKGMRRECVERRRQHGDIALDVLDTAFPKWRAGGEKGMRHRFDGCQRAPARRRVGQIGNDMLERSRRGRRRARHAVDVPAGTAGERGCDGTAGRTGRPDDKCDPISHRSPAPPDDTRAKQPSSHFSTLLASILTRPKTPCGEALRSSASRAPGKSRVPHPSSHKAARSSTLR